MKQETVYNPKQINSICVRKLFLKCLTKWTQIILQFQPYFAQFGLTSVCMVIAKMKFSCKSTKSFLFFKHLNNYFNFHVCLSFHLCLSIYPPPLSVQKLTPILVVILQNVTNKSCMVCFESEKYVLGLTLIPWGQQCTQNFLSMWPHY